MQTARNNLLCFEVGLGKTDMYKKEKEKKKSFFPRIMTVRGWHNLDESSVSAELIKEFKDHLSIHDQNWRKNRLFWAVFLTYDFWE